MTTANEIQHGGQHYKKSKTLQHWDVVERYGIGYCEGCSTKYVYRWRDKNGLEDLQKAHHYVLKLLELANENGRLPRGIVPHAIIRQFVLENDIRSPYEIEFLTVMFRWDHVDDLYSAHELIQKIIADAEQEIAGGK